ncbi:hypothetical protein PR048_005982 [Dryococelus australis]|uniref:Reverse transcriptase Ty1/copia-type domain-containing protein n=1 Tax=Dryococelus australis TaxID=614101 RepID=A0ABQ9IAN2_9NEOP|nr:hypothetical protein PR048_005982 [Dryococelus australis]
MIMAGYSGNGYCLWDPLKDKIVSSRDVTFNESKVGVWDDMAQYQEEKTDTEENGITKHGTPQQSSEESDEEFIGFEDPDKEKNKRNKPNRTVKKTYLQEFELYIANCLCAVEPKDYEDAIKLGNDGKKQWKTRCLYGLRSAPRKWNKRFHNFMETRGMKRSASDFYRYIGENVWLNIWVDDMLITGEKTQVENLIRLLNGEFKAKDLGILSEFLGTMIVNVGDEVQISQSRFINKILSKFNKIPYKGGNTPMVCDFQVDTEEPVNEKFMFWQLTGSIMYVATVSRPDISYSVCYLSRFLNKPTEWLWKAGKKVLRYLQQTHDLCLTFKPSSYDNDSDWAGDKLDEKVLAASSLTVPACGCVPQKHTVFPTRGTTPPAP